MVPFTQHILNCFRKILFQCITFPALIREKTALDIRQRHSLNSLNGQDALDLLADEGQSLGNILGANIGTCGDRRHPTTTEPTTATHPTNSTDFVHVPQPIAQAVESTNTKSPNAESTDAESMNANVTDPSDSDEGEVINDFNYMDNDILSVPASKITDTETPTVTDLASQIDPQLSRTLGQATDYPPTPSLIQDQLTEQAAGTTPTGFVDTYPGGPTEPLAQAMLRDSIGLSTGSHGTSTLVTTTSVLPVIPNAPPPPSLMTTTTGSEVANNSDFTIRTASNSRSRKRPRAASSTTTNSDNIAKRVGNRPRTAAKFGVNILTDPNAPKKKTKYEEILLCFVGYSKY